MLKIFEFISEHLLMALESFKNILDIKNYKIKKYGIKKLFIIKQVLIIFNIVALLFNRTNYILLLSLLIFILFYEDYLKGDWIYHRRKRMYKKIGINFPKKAKESGDSNSD